VKKAVFHWLYSISFLASLLLGLPSSAQAPAQTSSLQPPVQTSVSEEETLDIPRSRKFIYLTLGIDYDEKIPPMPGVISFKGDFKRVTGVSYLKNIQSLHFAPKSEGIASLGIYNKSGKKIAEYHLIVRKSKLDAVAREIQSLLGDIEGVTVRILNNKVIVDGQVLLPADMSRVLNVVAQFGDAASLVTMSPMALRKIADFIARDINNPEIEVRALNDKIILSGWANSEDEQKNAGLIAQFYMPPLVSDTDAASRIQRRKPNASAPEGVVNLIKIKQQPAPPPSKIVQVVLHYVELSKNYSKSFHFQFMPNIDDGSGIQFQSGDSSTGATSQFTGTINALFPKLNWLTTHGYARVLESGTVMVKEGEKAHFERTSKMPVNNVVSTGGAIASGGGEQTGIVTDVTPTLTGERSDSVDLDLSFKIMSPTGTTSSGLIVATNQIVSKLVVRSTQSAAVGGLITNNSVTGYNKLPSGAPANPILSLYTSKDFSRDQSQFVVFVTPIIRSSASAGAEKIKKKFRLRD
jgi:pilus assembly protein CpaC